MFLMFHHSESSYFKFFCISCIFGPTFTHKCIFGWFSDMSTYFMHTCFFLVFVINNNNYYLKKLMTTYN